jgi:hypothetical protein
MGSLPKPLLEQIVSNKSWLQNAQVRRALLTNPKLRGEGINRVLRMVPKAELRLMHKQTLYPPAVRSAAAKLAR